MTSSSPLLPSDDWYFGKELLKFLGVLFVSTFLGFVAFSICCRQPGSPEEYFQYFVFPLFIAIFSFFNLLFSSIFFWPVLFAVWEGVRTARQRKMLTLILASLECRVPLAPMVRSYAKTVYSPYYRGKLTRFADALEAGHSFQKALLWFPGLLRSDVVGLLDFDADSPTTLETIQRVFKEDQVRAFTSSYSVVRFVYLICICFMIMQVVTFIMVFIVPKFEEIFRSFDTELPLMTLVAMTFSRLIMEYWFLLLWPSLLLPFALIVYLLAQTDLLSARPWGLRRLFRNLDSARFLRLLSVGLNRNRPHGEVISYYCRTVRSGYLARVGLWMNKKIDQGHSWIMTLYRAAMIRRDEIPLLESAEKTGNLPYVLEEIAFSKDQAQLRSGEWISKILFVFCIFALAALVGFFIIAFFLPLIKLIAELSI